MGRGAITWINRDAFCGACGEILGTEEVDFGCFACGGDGFDDEDYQPFDDDVPSGLVQHPIPSDMPGSGPPCGFCGGATMRAGTCFTCQSCGETTGCG